MVNVRTFLFTKIYIYVMLYTKFDRRCSMLTLFLEKFDDEKDKIFFKEIYETYQQRMFKIAYKYLKDVRLSEDCVNDAFLALIDSFETFVNISEEKRGRYLCTITECCAFKLYNKEKKQEDIYEKLTFEYENSDFECIDKILIEEALEKMPFEYSYPLFLKYSQEQSYSQISEILNISEANARQRIKRGKDKLAEILLKGDCE